MPRAKFLHTADLHLSRPFGFLPPQLAEERRRDQRRTLGRIIDLALEERVDLLLVSGDLFDSADPDPTDLEAVTKEFSRFAEAGAKIFAIPGNHDFVSAGSFWHHLHIDGLHIFADTEWKSVVLKDLEISVSGIAFHRSKSERRALDSLAVPEGIPGIVLSHASFEQFEGQMDKYHPFSARDIATSGASYIALGHYHRYGALSESGTTACYPGTPEGLGFDNVETEDRQVVLGTIHDDGRAEIEPIKINRRTMRDAQLDCTSFDSRTSLFDAVRRLCDQNALLRLRLSGTPNAELTEALDEIPERFRESCLYLTIESADLQAHADFNIDDRTIRGRFCKHLLSQLEGTTDDEQRRLLRRALELGLAAFSER